MTLFVSFLDSPLPSLRIFGMLLVLTGGAFAGRFWLGIGKPLFVAAPTVLWLMNALWVASRVLKGYSFKIDLYLLYPFLSLLTLGMLVVYATSAIRDGILLLDERQVPEERSPLMEQLLRFHDPEKREENLLLLGGGASVLLVFGILVGFIAGHPFLGALGAMLFGGSLLVVGYLTSFIAKKDEEGRAQLQRIDRQLEELVELSECLKDVLQEFDETLSKKMESLPREAGEVYQRVTLLRKAFLDRITQVKELREKKRPEELEAAVVSLEHPIRLAVDSVNSIVTVKLPTELPAEKWEAYVNEQADALHRYLES